MSDIGRLRIAALQMTSTPRVADNLKIVDELISEPHLVERMIERTLSSGGDVVPLVPSAADALAEWDGVAAFLRW